MKSYSLFSFFLLVAFHSHGSDAIVLDPFRIMQMDPNDKLHGTVAISDEFELPYSFTIKAKGKGITEIGGISIRTYSAPRGQSNFEGFLLKHDFIDINDNGYRDLLLSGIYRINHDNESDAFSQRVIVAIFLFDPQIGQFKPSVKDEAVYFYESEGEQDGAGNRYRAP
ncbi:MAG: hypothetical protein JJT75_14940 [Opitutales bacterium]|nr:hypothetical protein [Opitutales bacterium]